MNAIIIKANDKVIAVGKISEITTKHYLDLQREAAKTILEKDKKISELEEMLAKAQSDILELTKKCNYLGKQIAIDRGEIEEDDESEYELVIKQEEKLDKEPIEDEPLVEEVIESEEHE